jgi:integrase
VHQGEERLKFGSGYMDHGLLFVQPDGSPLHPDLFLRRFHRLTEAAGLPRIRLHDLRHTWASLALQARIPVKVVSQRLGHANIRITLHTYTHVLPADDLEAAEKVAALFLG